MAKGSVRKKGKKWYYRFYVEDASGKMVQKEYAGTESKSETEKLLRKALEDYENKKFVAKADSLTVGELLDMWAEEELKTGTLSNGTVENYLGAIRCIKKHPIAERKLKTVTAEHLQSFLDLLTFGGEFPDGKVRKGYSKDYIHSTTIYLWLISLTASKELSILLLKLYNDGAIGIASLLYAIAIYNEVYVSYNDQFHPHSGCSKTHLPPLDGAKCKSFSSSYKVLYSK